MSSIVFTLAFAVLAVSLLALKLVSAAAKEIDRRIDRKELTIGASDSDIKSWATKFDRERDACTELNKVRLQVRHDIEVLNG